MTTSPQLITTKQAAELLSVTQRTILNWIKAEAIPYVVLPSATSRRRQEYRIPRQALLRSLSGTYDLATEFRNADAVVTDTDAQRAARAAT